MTNIVLEGPDNAGKSTLAAALIKAVPKHQYYHPGGAPDSLEAEEKFVGAQLLLATSKSPIVFDRLTPISQMVYNPDPALERTRVAAALDILQHCVLVYCRPSTDRLMRTDAFTWREGESEEHKQKIIKNQIEFIQRYDKLLLMFPHVTYSFDDVFAAELTEYLVEAMKGNRAIVDMMLTERRF